MINNFEQSIIYKNALKEYQDKIYWEILKPKHIIVIDRDTVYLFYNPTIIKDIYEQLIVIYNNEDANFPIHLWYEPPELKEIIFMWNKYKAIQLWYDKCDLPIEFEAKI